MVLITKYLTSVLVFLFMGEWLVAPGVGSDWDEDTSVQEILQELGEGAPSHLLPGESSREIMIIKQGEDIVKRGRTIGPNGKLSTYVSKYFICTNCHNIVQEDPDLTSRDPELRLNYAQEKRIPFLQGTTFDGIVNRESWYNDDYVKKYGDLVKPAHDDLREAIQLCAVQCSQGRLLEGWEMRAVLAYFWSLQFTLGDLQMTPQELAQLRAESDNPAKWESLRKLVKGKYLQTSPAHFSDAPPDKEKGYGLTGDPERGKALYELSCLHCHNANGVSEYVLDQSKMSFRNLDKKIVKDSHYSLYQIIRYGTWAQPGHRPYMPHYPLERMSDQQVEDLRSYVDQMSL
ncbi:MAG: cytochrome c [Bacteroidia bacterium]